MLFLDNLRSVRCRGRGLSARRSKAFGRVLCVWVIALLMIPLVHAFEGPDRTPSVSSVLAVRSPLIGTARAGERIIAVGLRGHIVYSDDDGKTWKQASVPVSTDLVAVSFPTPKQGWAVGHGGIVIHTADGGATWVKQMDGERFSELALSYYGKLSQTNPSPEAKRALEEAKALSTDGSTRALLDVYFESDTSGFVVGTFNRIFRTEDGGNTWTPWMDRTANPRELHFYSIHGLNGRVWLTGEQGMVWQLDGTRTHFESRHTPYKGTLFGSVLSGPDIFVFGMRGSLFHSGDDGQNWEKIRVPSEAGITGGVALGSRRMLLVNQAGTVLYSRDGGKSFEAHTLSHPMAYFGVGDAPGGEIALVGSGGVRVETLPQEDRAAASGTN